MGRSAQVVRLTQLGLVPDEQPREPTHEGRGEAIRKARQAGLEQARLRRLAAHRHDRQPQPTQDPDDVG